MELSLPRFVTRDEALRAALRQLGAAPGVPVLVAGRPGTGKTAFARALLALWTPRPARRVQAAELAGDSALMALVRATATSPVLLEDVDQLRPRSQQRLGEALRRGGRKWLVVTLRCEEDELATVLTTLPAALLRRVHIPPLARRRPDILLLAEHFLPRGIALDPSAAQALISSPWPEEARGLRAVLRVASTHALRRGDRALTLATLAPLLSPDAAASSALGGSLAALVDAWDDGEALTGLGLRASLRLVEAALLARALSATGGRVTAAARLLGTPPSTLKSRLAALSPELTLAARWLI